MKKVTILLREYGDYHIRHMDHDGFYGVNILHRVAREGLVQRTPTKDKILCLDLPPRIREVDVAIRKLPNWQMKCVRARFCAPLKEDGNLYTHREIAKLLGLSHHKYKQYLRMGISKVEKMLGIDY
jgi:hypothetical protein